MDHPAPRRRSLSRAAIAALTIGILLAVIVAGTVAGLDHNHQHDFESEVVEAQAAIEARLAVYEEVLEGLRGLYRADVGVTRAEFHRFADIEGLQLRWEGIYAVAFLRRVPLEEVDGFEAAVRADTSLEPAGYPDFAIRPVPVDEATVAEFIEPMVGNEGALGFDLSSEPKRAAALRTAQDSGAAVATAPLQLATGPSGPDGILIVAPVYEGEPVTVTDRRDQLVGFVVAAFKVEDLLAEALAAVPFTVKITDQALVGTPDAVLLDGTSGAGRSLDFETEFGGRTWVVEVQGDAETYPLGLPAPMLVGAAGVVASALLAFVVEWYIRDRREAEAATAAAREREVRLDPITGLLNRVAVEEAIVWELARTSDPATVSMLMVDIDMFKRVNDERGRKAGDELIRIVGEAIQRSAGEDAVVGRLIGDQFAVVIADVVASGERALALAHGVRRLIATIHEIGRAPVAVTASIGLAYGRDRDPEVLLADATAALHEAKRHGGDRVELFDQRLRLRVEREMRLETDLRRAIAEREFEVRYQPQASARTGEIIGFEALIRWQHPDLGLLPPMDFIPVAEQARLIHHLDRFVLETAACQQREWREALGRPVEIGVNLSGVTLVHDTIVDVVRQTLSRHEIDPGDLCIEVTETAIIDQPELAESRLTALRDLRVRLALDDFGTGYSSLTHLQRLPLTGIKIDRSFVTGLTTEARNAAIVEASIRLAQQLALRVVAEGVEYADQAAYLDGLDCDVLQGYLVGRPLMVEQATEMLASGHRFPVGDVHGSR